MAPWTFLAALPPAQQYTSGHHPVHLQKKEDKSVFITIHPLYLLYCYSIYLSLFIFIIIYLFVLFSILDINNRLNVV